MDIFPEVLVIILGVASAALAVPLVLLYLTGFGQDTDRERTRAAIPMWAIPGASFGLSIGTMVALQPLVILKWLIIPISALGASIAVVVLLCLAVALRRLMRYVMTKSRGLGDQHGTRS